MNKPILLLFLALNICLTSCEKELVIEPNNDAPDYTKVPTVKIRNYVNRIFIDLIGREPTNNEMDLEVGKLRNENLSTESRSQLLHKLMFSQSAVDGDTTYQLAYYKRLYELQKIRFLEGVSDNQLQDEHNIFLQRYLSDSLAGNMESAAVALLEANKIKKVLHSRADYMNGLINFSDLYAAMLNNDIYDFINMNSFNFVNACFNDLLFRYPSNAEFQISFNMVEDDVAGVLFQMPGNNKTDFIRIITQSREAFQGTMIWAYVTLLAREPSTLEINQQLNNLFLTKDLQALQKLIMISDEYANF